MRKKKGSNCSVSTRVEIPPEVSSILGDNKVHSLMINYDGKNAVDWYVDGKYIVSYDDNNNKIVK